MHKNLLKGCVEKQFCFCRNFRHKFNLSIKFKVIDSPERLWFKIHLGYFSFQYCFITVQWQSILKLQWSNGWVFVYRLSGSGFESSCIQVTIECGFTLKRVRDMIRTYSLFTFECLCLEPTKTGFGLSWLKYILSALSANQSHKLDKSFSSWFSN